MLRTIIIALISAFLLTGTAQAQTCFPAWPNCLSNGTTADASKVMANFNAAAPIANPLFSGSVGIGTTSIESGLLDIYSGGTVPAMTIHGSSGYAVTMKIINDIYSPGTYWLLANDSQGGFSLNQNGAADQFFIGRTGTTYALFYGTIYDSDGAIHTYSDRRLKTNIVSIDGGDALDKITRLNPVTYQWANPSQHDKISNTGGFVAQEVAQVMPHMVNQIACDKKDCDLVGGGKEYTLGLTPEFFAYLTKAVQELKARSDRDEQEISQLKAQIAAVQK